MVIMIIVGYIYTIWIPLFKCQAAKCFYKAVARLKKIIKMAVAKAKQDKV